MLEILLFLAQTTTDPFSGLSGWAGSGLLGSVLAWLLFVHLPTKDRLLKELVDSKDQTVQLLLERHAQTIKELEEGYREDLREVTSHCKAELATITGQFNKQLEMFHGVLVSAGVLTKAPSSRIFDRDEGG